MHHVMDPRYGVSKPAWLLIHVNVFRIHVGVSINGRTPLSLDGLFKENPIYKWMIKGNPHDLGNLHVVF